MGINIKHGTPGTEINASFAAGQAVAQQQREQQANAVMNRRMDQERSYEMQQQQMQQASVMRRADLDYEISAKQRAEFNKYSQAYEDAVSSGEYSPDELSEIKRQIDAKQIGIKPVARLNKKSPYAEGQGIGDTWVSDDGYNLLGRKPDGTPYSIGKTNKLTPNDYLQYEQNAIKRYTDVEGNVDQDKVDAYMVRMFNGEAPGYPRVEGQAEGEQKQGGGLLSRLFGFSDNGNNRSSQSPRQGRPSFGRERDTDSIWDSLFDKDEMYRKRYVRGDIPPQNRVDKPEEKKPWANPDETAVDMMPPGYYHDLSGEKEKPSAKKVSGMRDHWTAADKLVPPDTSWGTDHIKTPEEKYNAFVGSKVRDMSKSGLNEPNKRYQDIRTVSEAKEQLQLAQLAYKKWAITNDIPDKNTQPFSYNAWNKKHKEQLAELDGYKNALSGIEEQASRMEYELHSNENKNPEETMKQVKAKAEITPKKKSEQTLYQHLSKERRLTQKWIRLNADAEVDKAKSGLRRWKDDNPKPKIGADGRDKWLEEDRKRRRIISDLEAKAKAVGQKSGNRKRAPATILQDDLFKERYK